MSLTKSIVEGAYYEREDGKVFGPAMRENCDGFRFWRVGPFLFTSNGASAGRGPRLTRRVFLVPVDPADVVASLRDMAAMIAKVRAMSDAQNRVAKFALEEAADLVAEKLGVSNG